MTDIPTLDQIETRRQAIRLGSEALAKLAGIAESTLRRNRINPEGVRIGSLRKLDMALVAEERRLLQHLISLHPDFAAEQLSRRGGREKAGGEGVSTTAASPAATSQAAASTEEAA